MKLSLELYVAANWAAVVIYILATIANVTGVLFKKEPWERAGYLIAGAGLVLHSAVITVWWVEVGHGPYMAPNEVLSSDSWMVMACFLVFLKIYPRIRPVSILAFPATFLMLGLSLFYNPGIRTLPATFRSIWLVIHIGLYKISLATLIIAFAFSLFYLLKARRDSGWLRQLPPLETLDVYGYRFAGFGFIFWTIGMLAGSIWAHQSWGRFWGWDPTETWSLITCLMFGAYLHLRRFFRLKGSAAAWFFIACFIISLVSLFGMATLSSSIHSEYFR
ncbi:MAG: cytochrome c biogenesis protein CcsA [Desulfuromonadales bacterium]|nr:cytochrome c biogenesis protein CcsA [Desulfuromonadales bacterium]